MIGSVPIYQNAISKGFVLKDYQFKDFQNRFQIEKTYCLSSPITFASTLLASNNATHDGFLT